MNRLQKSYTLAAALAACLAWTGLHAQETTLQPLPQHCRLLADSLTLPDGYRLLADTTGQALSPALTCLHGLLPGTDGTASFEIRLGLKGDASVRQYDDRIPDRPEGYYLRTAPDGIVLAAADARGAFYAVQTLAQMTAHGKVAAGEVTDYPDIPFRGIVEGFYGTPWSHEARLGQIDFCGRNKMNVYIYGPKDDPYHSTPHWRQPYPDDKARQLAELADRARRNHVIFYWAIHPGKDIRWDEADRDLLLAKLETVYRCGVRGFAVFFDDITGDGTRADRQAELLNYIDRHFVQVKGDVAPLIICPTEYSKSRVKGNGEYLATLGRLLNPGIQIMWTGDRVVTTIDRATLQYVGSLTGRKAYVWWNYPVSDYVRPHLLMGPVYGNAPDVASGLTAFVANPMEHAEASKLALASIADYAWNPDAYDSDRSWHLSVRRLMPLHAASLETFAAHNADPGPNGHGFRRQESENIRPALQSLCANVAEHGTPDEDAYRQVYEECRRIVVASDLLMAADENRPLTDEIAPWLACFKLTGEYGLEVLRALRLRHEGQADACREACRHARALRSLIGRAGTDSKPGVKCATLHLLPSLDILLERCEGQ